MNVTRRPVNYDGLKNAINRCARRIEKFQSDGLMIGFENACSRIKGWIKNFENLLDNLSPLICVVDNISFIPDHDVLHQCLDFRKKYIDLAGKEIFYTCLGAETESSSRIMRQLNHDVNFAPNIRDLLQAIRERQVQNPAIVFIDDFLNSGGQLSSILNSWCQKNGSTSVAEDDGSRKYNKRNFIGEPGLELLKRCSLHFIYINGMAKGIEKARQTLLALGLKGDAHILNTYSDEIGIFGSRDDISHIRNHLPVPVSPESIFSAMSCDELAPLLAIFEKSGRELLKTNKPKWSDERIENRILGYGNSAKLFISQTNVPTCTLTCLWSGGLIEIEGKQIDWIPLIERIEKKIGGSENKENDNHPPGEVCHRAQTSDDFSELGSIALDFKSGASPPLDMTIFTPAPQPVTFLSPDLWKNATNRYTNLFEPDMLEYLGLNKKSSEIFVKELHPGLYSYFNNSVMFHLNEQKIPVVIKAIQIVTFGTLISFIGIRFQFKTKGMNLKEALDINYHLPINKNKKSKGPVLKIKGDSKEDLLNWLFSLAFTKHPIAFPMNDRAIRFEFDIERFKAFTFVREGSGLFEKNRRIKDIAFHLLAGFSNPIKIALKKQADFKALELDINASVSLSRKGATLLCAGDSGQNESYLHDHFQKRYYFLYLLVLHLHLLQRKLPLLRSENKKLAQEIDTWLNRFKAFPFGQACQKTYMNRFFKILADEMGVTKI
jgi:hypothetical protein